MSGVQGYIIVDVDGRVIRDDFGATTLHRDWLAATTQARAQGGGQLIPVLTSQRPADAPRRGRRPKQPQEVDN